MGSLMKAVSDLPILSSFAPYAMIELEFDQELQALFSWMKPSPRACFSARLLEEIRQCESLIQSQKGHINHEGRSCRISYVVFGSRVPGVFNLGGDLSMFVHAILRKDRDLLSYYAHLCVENQLRRHRGFDSEISTIALVQGKALGGGFECALACETIVAERSASMALPETLFNLFPGMGALSFLGRRIGIRRAEDLIVSGATFSAKELYEMGVIDELVEDGMGLESVKKIILHRMKRQNTFRALSAAKLAYQPVTDKEMTRIVDVWVEGALRLDARDLKMMTRLVRAQDRISTTTNEDEAIETMYSVPTTSLNAA